MYAAINTTGKSVDNVLKMSVDCFIKNIKNKYFRINSNTNSDFYNEMVYGIESITPDSNRYILNMYTISDLVVKLREIKDLVLDELEIDGYSENSKEYRDFLIANNSYMFNLQSISKNIELRYLGKMEVDKNFFTLNHDNISMYDREFIK